MAADTHRLLMNDGLFFYTSGTKAPNGKIRFIRGSTNGIYLVKLVDWIK